MAVTEVDEGARAGSSFGVRKGSAISEATEAASAWNSFCEAEGREAGAIGAEGVSRTSQHAGVAQCLLSQPARQQLL